VVLAAICLRLRSFSRPFYMDCLTMTYERMTPDEITQMLNRQTYEISNTQLKGMLLNAFRRIASLERNAQKLRARELKSVVPVRALGPRLMKDK
jgi:hypothetical protein